MDMVFMTGWRSPVKLLHVSCGWGSTINICFREYLRFLAGCIVLIKDIVKVSKPHRSRRSLRTSSSTTGYTVLGTSLRKLE